ncbi:PepSY domain-containing protein [Brevibacillus laterosporus]|nr:MULTISPECIES: PepSY-associated TM helix domain-containing protein [Brevibacillus]MCR8984715.1 PepSY domain-containing protein [Brevibacillus laterosporus]
MVWRWHFYAGVLFSPFLIILACSGALYLFKPQNRSIFIPTFVSGARSGGTGVICF